MRFSRAEGECEVVSASSIVAMALIKESDIHGLINSQVKKTAEAIQHVTFGFHAIPTTSRLPDLKSPLTMCSPASMASEWIHRHYWTNYENRSESKMVQQYFSSETRLRKVSKSRQTKYSPLRKSISLD